MRNTYSEKNYANYEFCSAFWIFAVHNENVPFLLQKKTREKFKYIFHFFRYEFENNKLY